MNELGLSARAHDKVLRVARTIADLAGAADIASEQISEAVNYRILFGLWDRARAVRVTDEPPLNTRSDFPGPCLYDILEVAPRRLTERFRPRAAGARWDCTTAIITTTTILRTKACSPRAPPGSG